jgi:hypothetical protein
VLLLMQGAGGRAQLMKPDDDKLYTGPMGDCVCVVVLAKVRSGVFTWVTGYHATGGLESVHFKSLFAFIGPDEPVCVFGFANDRYNDLEKIRVGIQAAIDSRPMHGATLQVLGGSSFSVDRNGNVEHYRRNEKDRPNAMSEGIVLGKGLNRFGVREFGGGA